jgi:hypothetical protein
MFIAIFASADSAATRMRGLQVGEVLGEIILAAIVVAVVSDWVFMAFGY